MCPCTHNGKNIYNPKTKNCLGALPASRLCSLPASCKQLKAGNKCNTDLPPLANKANHLTLHRCPQHHHLLPATALNAAMLSGPHHTRGDGVSPR